MLTSAGCLCFQEVFVNQHSSYIDSETESRTLLLLIDWELKILDIFSQTALGGQANSNGHSVLYSNPEDKQNFKRQMNIKTLCATLFVLWIGKSTRQSSKPSLKVVCMQSLTQMTCYTSLFCIFLATKYITYWYNSSVIWKSRLFWKPM